MHAPTQTRLPKLDWRAVALVCLSVLIGFLLCELAYRALFLFNTRNFVSSLPATLHIYWPAPFTYQPYGYDYGPPEREAAQVELKRDASQRFGYFITGVNRSRFPEFGNSPPVFSDHRLGGYRDVEYEKADLKILTFGDSFTASSWPDLLQFKLEQKTGLRIRVINFGRDFFGVMQMMDMAAYFVPRLRPDLALINFITDDLTRPRTWRGVTQVHGYDRAVISTRDDPADFNDAHHSLGDAALVNPIAEDLRREVERTGKLPPNDDVIIGLFVKQAETFARLAWARNRGNAFDFTSSLLLRRVWHGSAALPPAQFTISIDDYRSDGRTTNSAKALLASGIPLLAIHLPVFGRETKDRPVAFGSRGTPAQERRLLESFEQMMGQRTFYVGSQLPSELSAQELTQGPNDYHPNKAGATLYAEIIAEHLIGALKLRRKAHP